MRNPLWGDGKIEWGNLNVMLLWYFHSIADDIDIYRRLYWVLRRHKCAISWDKCFWCLLFMEQASMNSWILIPLKVDRDDSALKKIYQYLFTMLILMMMIYLDFMAVLWVRIIFGFYDGILWAFNEFYFYWEISWSEAGNFVDVVIEKPRPKYSMDEN